MKVPAYPPFIVFFDTIAIFLFVLILNQSSGFEFVLPEEGGNSKLFLGARMVYEKDGNYWFDDTNTRFPVEDVDVYTMVNCDVNLSCQNARHRRRVSRIYILIPESLHSEGGKISMLVSKNGCSSLKLYISMEGTVDRRKTYAFNPCLKNINGVDKWVNGKKNI